MKKFSKLTSILILVAMMFSLLVLPAHAVGGTYTLDISDIPDKTWENAQKRIDVYLNDQFSRRYEIKATEGLGSPVCFGIPVYKNGQKTNQTMSITLVPIRLLSSALGIPIGWDSQKGCATIEAKGQKVDLYPNATSITMPDGSTFQETEYTFPDGSPINLLVAREDRLYMPVRAFCELVFENASFEWGNNFGRLRIYAQEGDYVPETWVGVRDLNKIANSTGAPEFGLISKLSNLKVALEGKETEITSDYVAVDNEERDGGYIRMTINRMIGYTDDNGNDLDGFAITGADAGYLDNGTFYQVAEAALKDLVSDPQDVATLMEMIKDNGYSTYKNGGTIEDLEEWQARCANKVYHLNSVDAEWSDVGDILFIYNKV